MSVKYHLRKANVVAGTVNRESMGSVDHIEDRKKDLVKEVHHLALLDVRLSGSNDCGVMVLNLYWWLMLKPNKTLIPLWLN